MFDQGYFEGRKSTNLFRGTKGTPEISPTPPEIDLRKTFVNAELVFIEVHFGISESLHSDYDFKNMKMTTPPPTLGGK